MHKRLTHARRPAGTTPRSTLHPLATGRTAALQVAQVKPKKFPIPVDRSIFNLSMECLADDELLFRAGLGLGQGKDRHRFPAFPGFETTKASWTSMRQWRLTVRVSSRVAGGEPPLPPSLARGRGAYPQPDPHQPRKVPELNRGKRHTASPPSLQGDRRDPTLLLLEQWKECTQSQRRDISIGGVQFEDMLGEWLGFR